MTSVYSTSVWLDTREKALERDKVCQDCGRQNKLHVHHITPVREFDDPVDSHELDNLVVLCRRCHPKWEGSDDVPNLLDRDTRLKQSELVYDLSRDTLDNVAPEPMGEDIEAYWQSFHLSNPHRCGYCFAPLKRTRGDMLRRSKSNREGQLCSTCGHLPHFWRNFDSGAPDVQSMKERCELIALGLSEDGIYLDVDAMKTTVEVAWPKNEYFGEQEIVTQLAIRVGARHETPNVSDRSFKTPCPEPNPVNPA